MAEVKEEWAQPSERLLYVLRLQDDCFYIGQSRTENFEARIQKHFRGKGSAWTRLHPPIEMIEKQLVFGSYREIELKENEKVVEYMRRYGMGKVRGGFFASVDETVTEKNLRHHKIVL